MQNKVMTRVEVISFLLVLLILVFADGWILLSDVRKESKIIDGIASWWLAKAYFAEAKPPDVVVLGSSQLGPLLGADALVFDRVVDITGDYCSYVLEYDLHAILNKNWRVFIGALPGAMISDQLVISRSLFSKEYKPKLVAIMLSPRDFIDKDFPSATSTEACAFFSKYNDPISLRANLDKANIEKYKFEQPYNCDFENKSSLTLGKPFERISPGKIVICAGDSYSFIDNTEEYRRRYREPLSPQLDTQIGYFDALLKYLAKQDIQVVVFNLPLTANNKKLLSDKFWKEYDNRISEISRKNGADYISLERVVLPFQDNEFSDGIHLNLAGGHRLSKTVALFIANKFGLKPFQELLARDKYLK